MRLWKPQLALAVAAGAILALAVTLYVTLGVIEVLVVVLVVAALAGLYFLRRYARAVLVYSRPVARRRRPMPHPKKAGT